MKSQSSRSKVRRPPKSQTLPLSSASRPEAKPARAVAGGPSTRGDSTLGRLLADFLAYFEARKVCPREIDLMRPTHENGWLRPMIEAKLARLHPTCPDHQELERLVRLSLDLLSAVDDGQFKPGPAWAEVEPRLLRALAYFVSEQDAIPDHLPTGFDDDMREFQGLAERAGDLFTVFEALQPHRRRPARGSRHA